MGAKTEFPLQYWKADDHQWGRGKIHVIHEDGDRTLCGKLLSECPGRHVPADEFTCQACAGVMEARDRRKRREEEWAERAQEYALKGEARRQEWQIWYDGYLRSPKWREKHNLVLARENSLCEACRRRRATQVHHTTYAHVGNEPLFELRAICKECHEWLTAEDRRQRGETWTSENSSLQ